MARLRGLAGIFLLSVLPLAGAAAQDRVPAADPPQLAGPRIPDRVVYRFFFAHLENLDRVASQLEAAGKDGKGWRSHEQRAAGLSADEGAALKRVAADCNLAVKQHRARMRAALAARPGRGKSFQEPSPELRQLAQDGEQIVDRRIEELRSRLGEPAFQKLDSYLRKSFKPRITTQTVAASRVPRGAQ